VCSARLWGRAGPEPQSSASSSTAYALSWPQLASWWGCTCHAFALQRSSLTLLLLLLGRELALLLQGLEESVRPAGAAAAPSSLDGGAAAAGLAAVVSELALLCRRTLLLLLLRCGCPLACRTTALLLLLLPLASHHRSTLCLHCLPLVLLWRRC
jgi:hypothetical protein